MRKNNCEEIRRELDELMLEEAFSASTVEHLKECSACRDFNETQTKLRRMVGGLGTVAAPADFDFRLRARLANDSGNGAFHYWPLMQKGFAAAAVVIVFAFGVVVVRNLTNQPKVEVVQTPPVQQESPKAPEITKPNTPVASGQETAHVPASGPDKSKRDGVVVQNASKKRPLTAVDFSKEGVGVLSAAEPSDTGVVFPIDATLQPLRLSLDDGRGNAKTISVPTIRFGSQRMLPNKNQLAEKGIW